MPFDFPLIISLVALVFVLGCEVFNWYVKYTVRKGQLLRKQRDNMIKSNNLSY